MVQVVSFSRQEASFWDRSEIETINDIGAKIYYNDGIHLWGLGGVGYQWMADEVRDNVLAVSGLLTDKLADVSTEDLKRLGEVLSRQLSYLLEPVAALERCATRDPAQWPVPAQR